MIGALDQIAVGLPVNKAEQHQDEDGKGAGSDGGRAKGGRADKLWKAHKVAGYML